MSIAKWDVKKGTDPDPGGYTCRLNTSGDQNFLFFPAGKDYWSLRVRLENNSEVTANFKFRPELTHTAACTKTAGHTGSCSNVPTLTVINDTGAAYSYTAADGVTLPWATGGTAQEMTIRIPRQTFTGLQIYCDAVQVD
ncbi:MAG: hypothetical protein LBR73_07460 [Oscillospiraceae bacterium]|nr:hypothetical protein [Oscillospiraceae bacterium]